MERLGHEFSSVGFFLSGHPLDEYESVLPKLGAVTYDEFEARAERGATAGRLAAIVVSARERKSQKGSKFAFALFSDQTGQYEAVIFSDTLAQSRDLLAPGTAVLISVEGERDGESLKLRVLSMEALDKAANAVQRGLKVVLDRHLIAARKDSLGELKAMLVRTSQLDASGGEIHFVIELEDRDRELEFSLPGKFDVSPARRGALSTVPGVLEVVEI
jgi:DNA polymerase-3 subunit alpha